MRVVAVAVLIGFAFALAGAAAPGAATEPVARQTDSPHSRRDAILNRVGLKPGNLSELQRRAGSRRARFNRGKIEETYDKVLLSPST